MVKLSELNFRLKVTRINRRSIDKLIELAESYRNDIYETLRQADEGPDSETIYSLGELPVLEFSLYALAITHCYSILENNRTLICEGIPGISEMQKKPLHNICVVTQFFGSIGIDHKKVKSYETMDEFRQVNNAIKHSRFGLATSVTTRHSKIEYDAKRLKSLYLNEAKQLESYLLDLYERTNVP